MIETCDVLVIGLGPAGSSAAIAAAREGVRVMAFDRKREAGVPVQCAEFVPMMLGIDSGPVTFAQVQPIDAMESFVETRHDRHNDDFRGRMVDRAKFDRELVRQAQEAGAQVVFGEQVESIDRDGVVAFLSGRRVASRVLIGADGPRSRVGAVIGCVNSGIVETRQVAVPLRRAQASTDIYLSAEIKGGYAWVFPKGEVANVGLGVDRSCKERLKPLLESLLDHLAAEDVIGREPISHTGGAIPVGGPVGVAGRLGGTQVLLAGDAAGLTNPITGAGIPAACQSGRMAGETAACVVRGREEAVADYYDDIEDLFGASLRRAVDRRDELMASFAHGNPTRNQLRRGWIAYPAYWAADYKDTGETNDELLEA
ncbi:MAG: NAD(P)/FAD-dependent oxidoreductase [Sphingomonadales bacterium]|nr:NAD(P)/FAD-dependent oxidoreductase [Sphingomonadales bacterium]MDE2568477.1 NAD(P)/FAD-dependent oxidoreductase [Sphingomonadales bacterium]